MEESEFLVHASLLAIGAHAAGENEEPVDDPEDFDSDDDSDDESEDWDDDDDDDTDEEDLEDWVTIGYATDKVTADYIIDSLQAYDIPATIINKSGFLGDIGIPLAASPFGGGTGAYEIMTPAESIEEAPICRR